MKIMGITAVTFGFLVVAKARIPAQQGLRRLIDDSESTTLQAVEELQNKCYEFEEKINSLSKRAQSNEQASAKNNVLTTQIQNGLQKAEQERLNIAKSINRAQTRLQETQTDCATNAEAIAEVENRVKDTEQAYIQNQEEISQVKRRIENAEQSNGANSDSIAQVERWLRNTEKSCVYNDRNITQVRKRVQDTEKKLLANSKKLSKIQSKERRADNERRQLQRSLQKVLGDDDLCLDLEVENGFEYCLDGVERSRQEHEYLAKTWGGLIRTGPGSGCIAPVGSQQENAVVKRTANGKDVFIGEISWSSEEETGKTGKQNANSYAPVEGKNMYMEKSGELAQTHQDAKHCAVYRRSKVDI